MKFYLIIKIITAKNVLNLYKKHLVILVFHYNWYAEFNRGRDHFDDEPRAGRPRNSLTPENIGADPYMTY